MAKSMRCKRVKRLRAIRREIVEKESFTLTRDDAKSAAIEAALAAPKLPVRQPPPSPFMEVASSTTESASASDVEMDGEKHNKSLKPIGRKLKKKFKMGMKNRRSKGFLRGKRV
ncbi:hypothetical protein BRARA_G00559 [Brassica rapa]|uniref:Uncharacterized protein n=3 Tax=Brassica TaxID=3705 RepID=A0A397YI55_BRACM|nr:uncharacterized protein LOC103828795 [Brassica rapa]XP_048592546.1 uncharacterized protein LOC125576456 [Brassica napus]KAG5378448.1 hypothetical protein IGI04_026290 [Brassica rapa subsp. trilocularis]KAH0917840.1 hypothetical protein HID58_025500 [Brassica napus]RID53139.1 hypothetical protein BRARA_G00559 [Brassica rapa]CAF2159374.1 unnamed protein product [Brassica napus]CAG7901488.1 unnamed protein product [Brassica rapa]